MSSSWVSSLSWRHRSSPWQVITRLYSSKTAVAISSQKAPWRQSLISSKKNYKPTSPTGGGWENSKQSEGRMSPGFHNIAAELLKLVGKKQQQRPSLFCEKSLGMQRMVQQTVAITTHSTSKETWDLFDNFIDFKKHLGGHCVFHGTS